MNRKVNSSGLPFQPTALTLNSETLAAMIELEDGGFPPQPVKTVVNEKPTSSQMIKYRLFPLSRLWPTPPTVATTSGPRKIRLR